jgi:CTP synthase
MVRYIFVAGGVISGVGKGVITASVGKILKNHGYRVSLIKIDPYINCDAGTLRPTEHGEVWVTHDGGEIDQDLGTYERFLNEDLSKQNNITTGQIYKTVIDNERQGFYLGQTVQFVPHIVDAIKNRIRTVSPDADFVIIELGGTVGDYENIPYLTAIKSLERELGADRVAYMLVTYLPIPGHLQEMKTKPTQQAIKLLGQEGILPDFVICRGSKALDVIRKKKIEMCVNIPADRIIAAPDLQTIYDMPLCLEQEELGAKLLRHFNLAPRCQPDWKQWQQLVARIQKPASSVSIAVVGKYLESGDYYMIDSYVSIYHALIHAGAALNVGIEVTWIDAKEFEKNDSCAQKLEKFSGIIIPGGFGNAGIEGKIQVIRSARTRGIPYLGLCYGMQLAVIEFARNVVHLTEAHTTEVDPATAYPVIDILPVQKQILAENRYGATMRLGNFQATVTPESLVAQLYNAHKADFKVTERHRHRYEVNPEYVSMLEKEGLLFSGYYEREDGTRLMEFLELPGHPFFIATQAHPEFRSRLEQPSPLFYGFIQAAYQQSLLQSRAGTTARVSEIEHTLPL